jgi:ornithine cyclodeaminase/alanine dehydrogenase-like protein (mu-crystallin family)
MEILTDDDLNPAALMPAAIEAIEVALLARRQGRLVAPPRMAVPFGGHGSLMLTIGGTVGDDAIAGLRVYDTFEGPTHSQVTVVWSAIDARLIGIVVGERLGEIRTGAIGGVAIRHMSAPDAKVVAVIGTGRQAAMQLLAASVVRQLSEVRVFSRNEANRRSFAAEMTTLIGVPVEVMDGAEQAVSEADIVICATTSATPAIRAEWLKAGAHVTTVGPKTTSAHELDSAIADRATLIATDSPEQAGAYSEPFFLHEALAAGRIVDLAAIAEGSPPRSPSDITLFCSVGLAGTEVLVASAIFDALNQR